MLTFFCFCLLLLVSRAKNMKIKFNKTSIEGLLPLKNKEYFASDIILPGLYVRVRSSGHKSFYAIYRLRNHKQQKIRIGEFPAITVETAREKCRELLGLVFDGHDPVKQIKDRAFAEADPAVSGTVRQLYDKYMAEHAIHKKPSSRANDVIYWERHILPRLGDKAVRSVTRGDISQIHNSIGQEVNDKGGLKTTTANRVLEVLKKAFNLAEEWEWRDEGSNPCRRIKKFAERPRRRYLSVSECVSLYSVLTDYFKNENYHARQVAYLVMLLLYTGGRRGEIINCKWSYFVPERSVLALPDSKANRPQDIQLSNEALEILSWIKADQQKNGFVGDYIFDGHVKGQPLKDEGDHWDNIRASAGLKDFRMHDLRHSFASFLAMTTGSQVMVKEALRHADVKTSDRYTHMFNDPLRLAVNQTTARLREVMSGGVIVDFDQAKQKYKVA